MVKKEFSGRTALVTGGSRGIGRAVCLGLAREGARVALNYVDYDEGAREVQRLVEAEGVACGLFKADVSSPAEVTAMVEAAARELAPIDLLVTCAGIIRREPETGASFDTWRETMAVNADGTYLPVMALKDGMIARGFGRIVCISSIAALRPRPRTLAYSAAKAAVIAFVRSAAHAFAPHVRINCVAPGLIETDMAASIADPERQAMIDATPMKRIGDPEEIAEAVLFLLSERSSFTTGQTFVASGGRVTLP